MSEQGIRTDPKKLVAVPTPKDIKSLVSLASYYRRFIPHFSKIAGTLHGLTKKEVAGRRNAGKHLKI